MSKTINRTYRLQYFDVARFLAIFGVIIVHVGQNSLPGYVFGDCYNLGRFGVQLFFVISGATVFLSFQKSQSYSKKNVVVFYVKRFFRIVPLFVLMALLYSLIDGNSFVQSVLPWNGINPYAYNNIEGGWSIWNEMYFYLIFPLYFYYRSSKLFNILLPTLFVLISMGLNLRLFPGMDNLELFKDFDYLNFFTQFICFVFGVEYLGKKVFNIISYSLIYIVPGLIIKALYYPDYLWVADYGSLYWTPMIAAASLFILHGVKKMSTPKNQKRLKWLAFLGQKTYTTYMVHFLVIRGLFRLGVNLRFELQLLIVTSASFVLTIMIQNYTENIWTGLAKRLNNRLFD